MHLYKKNHNSTNFNKILLMNPHRSHSHHCPLSVSFFQLTYFLSLNPTWLLCVVSSGWIFTAVILLVVVETKPPAIVAPTN